MRTILAALIVALTTAAGFSAITEAVEEKYKIPVPTEQRKIAPGEEKGFSEDSFHIRVNEVERTSVTLSINGGEPFAVPNSVQSYAQGADGQICVLVFLGMSGEKAILSARCDPETTELRAALTEQQNAEPVEIIDPSDLIAEDKGTLTNPYLGDPQAIAEGHQLYLANSCNGCHGGTGGGGMAPALSNGVWVYGNADDTLFRLVLMGTDGLQGDGFARVNAEKVVGPMPPYIGIIDDADKLWKILAWVRSVSPSDAPPEKSE